MPLTLSKINLLWKTFTVEKKCDKYPQSPISPFSGIKWLIVKEQKWYMKPAPPTTFLHPDATIILITAVCWLSFSNHA